MKTIICIYSTYVIQDIEISEGLSLAGLSGLTNLSH